MRLATVAMCVAFVAAQAGVAGAQPSQTAPTAPAPYSYQPPPSSTGTHTERYGKTIAIVDGLSFGAMFLGAMVVVVSIASESSDPPAAGIALLVGGAVGLLAGGPIVHLTKHNSSSAWKSLALRVGLPLLGEVLGKALDGECDPNTQTCDNKRQGQLGGLGLLGAMVIDWVWLAKHQVTDRAYVAPYAAPGPGGGMTLGLGGRF